MLGSQAAAGWVGINSDRVGRGRVFDRRFRGGAGEQRSGVGEPSRPSATRLLVVLGRNRLGWRPRQPWRRMRRATRFRPCLRPWARSAATSCHRSGGCGHGRTRSGGPDRHPAGSGARGGCARWRSLGRCRGPEEEPAPREQASRIDAQLAGNNFGGLAAGEPVLDGLAFEGWIELTTGLGRGVFQCVHTASNYPSPPPSIRGNPNWACFVDRAWPSARKVKCANRSAEHGRARVLEGDSCQCSLSLLRHRARPWQQE